MLVADNVKRWVSRMQLVGYDVKLNIVERLGKIYLTSITALNNYNKHYISIPDNIVVDTYRSSLFLKFSGSIKLIINGEVENLSGLFAGNKELVEVELEVTKRQKELYISDMFLDCIKLKSVKITKLEADEIPTASQMFNRCSRLEEVDIRGIDFSNCLDMSYMFQYCSSLKELDVSYMNTSQCQDMTCMFKGCTGLKKLDISNFNTKMVKYMSEVFMDMAEVEELNTSRWYLNGARVNGMFSGCRSLKYVDLGLVDTHRKDKELVKVLMNGIVNGCSELLAIKIGVGNNVQCVFISEGIDKLKYIYCNNISCKEKIRNKLVDERKIDKIIGSLKRE